MPLTINVCIVYINQEYVMNYAKDSDALSSQQFLVWVSYEDLKSSLESTVLDALAQLQFPPIEDEITETVNCVNDNEGLSIPRPDVDLSKAFAAVDTAGPASLSVVTEEQGHLNQRNHSNELCVDDYAESIPTKIEGRLSADLTSSPLLFDYDDIYRFNSASPFEFSLGGNSALLGAGYRASRSNNNFDHFVDLVTQQNVASAADINTTPPSNGNNDSILSPSDFQYSAIYGSETKSKHRPSETEVQQSPMVTLDSVYGPLASPAIPVYVHHQGRILTKSDADRNDGHELAKQLDTSTPKQVTGKYRDFSSLRPWLQKEQLRTGSLILVSAVSVITE